MSAGDKNLVANLRFRWRNELQHRSDEELVFVYGQFALSDMYGQNDKYFLDFIREFYPQEVKSS